MVNYILTVVVEGQNIQLEQWYVKKSELLRSLIEENYFSGNSDNSEPIVLSMSYDLFKITEEF